MRLDCVALLLVLLMAGCVTAPPPTTSAPPVARTFPANGLLTQRAVLTVHGRQFALNGYLALSEDGGARLIMTESFGGLVADVLVKRDGSMHVMRSSRVFPPDWIRRFVAADLDCILNEKPAARCPIRMLSATHFVIERRGYQLDLQTVDTKPGPQSPELFDEKRAPAP